VQSFESPLLERVRELLVAHKDRELRSTTGVHATVDELVLRVHGLEQAVAEIASEVERLSRSQKQLGSA
jgi:hypothetical protein